ncbi:MAG: trypsin-like peptidase domain-containing protein [Micropruina sp.]|nr:trypsin-like peptidase domain-containing protein [Micropruina sp.]
METARIVLIRYEQNGTRRVGSGLRIGGNNVLTAAHVAAGTDHTVRLIPTGDTRAIGNEHDATVTVRSGDPTVDLAVLTVPSLPELSSPAYARVDRDIIASVTGCHAVGFPDFRKDASDNRRTEQVDGIIPTSSGFTASGPGGNTGYLTLKATGPQPQDRPRVSGVELGVTDWAGMSGAVVFTDDDRILGVIRHHNPPEGTGSLAVTPITAIDTLPDAVRSQFWEALGVVNPDGLPVLPQQIEQVLLRATFGRLLRNPDYAVFAGRDDAVQAVENFLAGGGGILVVTAPAGFGKTALMASLVRSDPDRYVYHFFTRLYDQGWLDERFFLESILEQFDPAASAELRGLALDQLKARFQAQLLAPAGPLATGRALLLDGLDEVSGWSPADYLAVVLPPGVHAIVSIRDTGQDWAAQYRFPENQLTMLPLEGFGQHGIVAVFTATGAHAADLIHQAGAADLIASRAAYQDTSGPATQGADPLYVHFLAQDANVPGFRREDLQILPIGFIGYLDRWWVDIRAAAPDGPVKDLLATLVVAHGPLDVADLRSLVPAAFDDPAGWADDYFDTDVLPTIRRLVTGGDAIGYALAHPRLARYLRTKTANVLRFKRVALLDYCARWAEHSSRYALAQYPTHVAEDRPEHFASVVTDLEYLETAIRALGISGVAQALRAALVASEHLTPRDRTTVDRVIRLASRQAHHIRPPFPVDSPGYVALQLRLQDQSVAERLFGQQDNRPGQPGVSVSWSTASISPAEIFTLPGDYLAVTITPDSSLAILALGNVAQVWELGSVSPAAPVATFAEHSGNIVAIAVTADGQRAISTAEDETMWVWEIRTGRPIRRLDPTGQLRGDAGRDMTLVVRPQTTQVMTISQSDRAVRVWDFETGVLAHILHGHVGPLQAIAVTADGALGVSTDLDGKVFVWDLASGKQRFPAMHRHTDWTSSVATGTLASGRRLAVTTGEDGLVCVWDLETGELDRLLTDHSARVWDVAVSTDGKRAISVGAIDVMLWNLDDGSKIAKLDGHNRDVFGVELDAGGDRAITCGVDPYVCIWDAHSGAKLSVLYGHSDSIQSAVLSPDGTRAVTVSGDGTARVWDTLTRGESGRTGHTDRVISTAISRNGRRVVTGGEDGSAQVWDAASGLRIRTLVNRKTDHGHFRDVTGVAISANGRRVLTTGRQHVRLWNVSTGRRIFDRRAVWCPTDLVMAPDGSCAITLDGQTAQVWELPRGAQRCALESPNEPFVAVAIMQNGVEAVTAGEDGIARHWDLRNGRELREMAGHSSTLTGIALTPDGHRIVTSSADGTARIWRLADRRVLATLRDHSGALTGVSLSRDGKRCITSSEDGLAILWDVESGRPLRPLEGHTAPVLNAAFAAGGRVITLGADKTLRTWNEATGNQEHLIAVAAAPSSFTTAIVEGRSIIVVGERSGAVTVLGLQ